MNHAGRVREAPYVQRLRGDDVLEAETAVLFFGGPPLGTRLMQGNVIASSTARLEQALRELP